MSLEIYNQTIRAIAEEAKGAGRLAQPDASAVRDTPICGDRVTVEVTLRDGVIRAFAHEVTGCILCQASASIIGRHAVGQDADELNRVVDALEAMLKRDGPVPAGWDELECFIPVRTTPSRHGCVLLPFKALVAALG